MRTLNNYIGIKPYDVLVDDSKELQDLAKTARILKPLSFEDKLQGIKNLTIDSMDNAYEKMKIWEEKESETGNQPIIFDSEARMVEPDKKEHEYAQKQHEKYRNIVFELQPLSHALKNKSGCCRYQGTLFFVLGYEADLGDKHFLHSAPVNNSVNTVFNEVINDGESHKISIFRDSLKDKKYDYSKNKPKILDEEYRLRPGKKFYSYHRTPKGSVIVENEDKHITTLDSKL